MKNYTIYLVMWIGLLFSSCEEFVEVSIPDDRITSETVFNSEVTANSAVQGIYNQLFSVAFSSGRQNSVTVLSGLSADNLEATVTTESLVEFEQNEIFVGNSSNLSLWSSAYNVIYMANAVLEGLENSRGNISNTSRMQLRGEALFIRSFSYFYLVNLYGDVPLVLTTAYSSNADLERTNRNEVYEHIIIDLNEAADLLEEEYQNEERLRANRFAVLSLLARVYLYTENWEMAEQVSTRVIEAPAYRLNSNLNDVFLSNNEEAIWQISPLNGGSTRSNTNEGDYFIMLNNRANVALTQDLLGIFEPTDSRLSQWVGSFSSNETTYYFPYKYKIKNAVGEASEYSTVLRLAEQYLIRSEARAHLNRISQAIADLNKIRQRANLGAILETELDGGQMQLLDSIKLERRRELFTEWGHRWLDLKRWELASQLLSDKKEAWQPDDVLYPIPEEEIRKNYNLTQNDGY